MVNKTLTLDKSATQKIGRHLERWLADNYLLYLKTQNFHWNVIDPRFHSLHEMFEEQYKNLSDGIDEIAERMRMIGLKTPASMKEFLELTSLTEAAGNFSGNEMITALLNDHETIANYLRAEIEEITAFGDQGTADLMIRRLQFHEKSAWMLKASL
ncbi:MAG TPA: DNA starvation/stationary phase protection protein [Parachlamydiaceae bacterium]|nr:DNA starvation/stationary phase protection protein [Parachlamydiaceae bacterium]